MVKTTINHGYCKPAIFGVPPWHGHYGHRGDVQRGIFANRDLAWASGGWKSMGKAMEKAMGKLIGKLWKRRKHRHFMGKP